MHSSITAPTPPGDDARDVSSSGTRLLAFGASIGLIGVAGAAIGAVCPLCVVAAPALLGAGVVQKLRALVLSRSKAG